MLSAIKDDKIMPESGEDRGAIPKYSELTPKQAKFAELLADGESQADAYREAYNTKAKKSTIYVNSSKLANNPKIKQRVEQLQSLDDDVVVAQEKLNQQWVLDKLREEANNKKNSAATRVRALELLGKKMGMFEDNTVVIKDRSSKEIEDEILNKLSTLFGAGAEA